MEAFVRESKRKILSLAHNMEAVFERKRVNAILNNYDSSVIVNKRPKEVKSVLFIITRMVRFHGGQTSVLRLGTQLANQGYKVYYAVYKNQSQEEMEICAKSNLDDFKGTLISSKQYHHIARKKAFDVIVATSWDTVSFAKQQNGYKMYFVQDYEPYFYSFGEMFLLAKKTYEQGLHMVSLGAWNKDMIEKNCKVSSPIEVIDFPYESKEYPYKERDYDSYSTKKTIILAVYLKYYGKRLPCIIPYMLNQVKRMLHSDGITLDIRYFGEARSFTTEGGTNLGMLSKKELCELYYKADFGMLASMSNISLTPYEMIATGLPVIEFSDGTFEYFFPKNSAIMTSIEAKVLYEKLKEAILNPDILRKQHENAFGYMKNLSWEQTGRQFGEILESL